MKKQTNTLALMGALLVFLGFVAWYAIWDMAGIFIGAIGLILFAVGAIQESEKNHS